MFKVFDVDESGTMDFAEYVQATHALTLNSVDDKLEWIFCLFDSDGGGTVDMDEIEVSSFVSIGDYRVWRWRNSAVCKGSSMMQTYE